MHHALLSFLGLAPAILALPSVFPPVQVGQSVIPPDTLYYYRYNRIPLSLYGNELMTETFRHSEAMMSNMIKDFTCIANDKSICPSERWYCNSEKNKCMQKALIGETCRSDDACFSGYCRSRCSIRPGHFGAGCTDDNQCSSGLVCRRDSHHQNELRCLDRSDNGYGLAFICLDAWRQLEVPFFQTVTGALLNAPFLRESPSNMEGFGEACEVIWLVPE
ncbi:hypothetical protein N7539_005054 [Penicillium diatomitis]|uniref:Uncharacterized protein n=1 Tax=Penicillium diatomitis TaxID=2819901 RepID=A0A9W9X6J5_9EURO|nr:uncharacterized protein N7539_005054 [Penicillium diatomitis]KAJ5485066.1 hypothetical protein N7539_005054 [Penicillium diatomitis]